MAAVGSTGAVNFSSGGGKIDSYDSSVGSYASGTAGYSAILTGSTVTLATAQVKGYVATPPNASGDVALSYGSTAKLIGPSTSVGV